MSPSSWLATGVAIIIRGKLLLSCETEQGTLQLPGYFVEEGKKAISHLQSFLFKNKLSELSHQTLYLSEIALHHHKKIKATGVVRVIELSKATEITLPKCQYLSGKQLSRDEKANVLLKAVAQWLNDNL
ncbi:MAG: hypothetical protein ACFFCH_04900 [Promethearchaeota archaeon]